MCEHSRAADAYVESLARHRGFGCRRVISWRIEQESLEAVEGPYLFEGWNETHLVLVVVERDGCLIRLRIEHGQLLAWAASDDRAATSVVMEGLRELFPEPDFEQDEPKASFEFSWSSPHGGAARLSRTLDVVRWRDISENYPASTRSRLGKLVQAFEPERSGQTLIWHGEPGTGKTNALRALAFEWRPWCDFTVITDPDRLFGSDADYLMGLIATHSAPRARWRAMVLEDAGELLVGDARRHVGQGLSRFLNTCDGLLGQVQKLLLLVTTNEPLGRLHPAVTRPGRCAAEVKFQPMGVAEANAWLARRKSSARTSSPVSLAELYELAGGVAPIRGSAGRRPIGFGRALDAA